MTGREETKRMRMLALLTAICAVAAAGGALVACETEEPYAECKLDPEVTDKGICAGDEKAGVTSCVVTKHPHCSSDICLSYFGKDAICTQTCTGSFDCPANSFCWTFAEESKQRYCVPNSLK